MMANTQPVPNPMETGARMDHDWLTVMSCGVCLVLSVGSLLVYVFGVFVRPLTGYFHWTRTEVARALVIGQFVVALGSPLWGFLIKRFGPRRIILPFIVGMTLTFASLSLLTRHLWQLYLLFALFSLLGRAASPIGYAAVLVRAFERHLGLALGLALMSIGWALHSFRRLLRPLSPPGLALGLRCSRVSRVRRDRSGEPRGNAQCSPASAQTCHQASGYRSTALDPRVSVMSAVLMLIAISVSGVFANLIPMLADRGLLGPTCMYTRVGPPAL